MLWEKGKTEILEIRNNERN